MKKRITRSRKSSFPFLSGDSFLHISDSQILAVHSKKAVLETLFELNDYVDKDPFTLFVEASYLENSENLYVISDWLANTDNNVTNKSNLLIHNGDVIPDHNTMALLLSKFFRVFSVNAVPTMCGVRPLPIGLENRHHKRNGIGREFELDRANKFKVNSKNGKTNVVFSSFSTATNTFERNRLLELLNQYGYKFIKPNLSPRDYRDQVRKSQFVLSPPGNGIDCHRTWESIYLGAIPVVLREYLHPTLVNEFPIIAVDEWENFLSLSDEALDELAAKYNDQQFNAMSMHYWQRLIRG